MTMTNELPPGGPPPHVMNMSADMGDTHNSIFYAAVRTTRMPMIVTDPKQEDNPIVFANPAFLKMTGYDKEDLIGKNCRLLQGPDTDRDTVSEIREAIENRREIAVEMLNYKKNGSSFWNALFVSPVFDEEENLIYFFASQLDVTRRREAEDALRQSQKMEAVGQLTGGIAHDFNNLLTVIQGYSEILQVSLENDNLPRPSFKRAVDAIITATSKASTLTSQLLAFARQQKLDGRIVHLPDLVSQLRPLMAQSVGDGVSIIIKENPNDCNVKIDTVQAEMALINIAANARDAMNRSGTLTIETGSCDIVAEEGKFSQNEEDHYSYVAISDTGSGMSPEILTKITDPFFTTKAEGKGTGLGMSMVYGFVKQSGGLLRIASEVGKGTTVSLYFRCENARIEAARVQAQKPLIGKRGDQETILIVDDRADVADLVEAMLSDVEYTIIKTYSAEDALKVLEGNDKIDLLFSDIVMPGSINGVDLARKAVELRPKLKVLLATGFADSTIQTVGNDGVAFDVIRKPYKRVDLVRRIRRTIDGPDGVS